MATETLRDSHGHIIATIQSNGSVQTIRDEHGHILGNFDGKVTRDEHGHIVGNGNLLTMLIKK